MRKYLLIILVILIFTYNVEAAKISKEEIEFNGGLTYNNYLYKKYDIEQGEKELDNNPSIIEDLHQGSGYYIETVYWFNHHWGLQLGLQKNEMKAEWESNNQEKVYKVNLDTYYSGLMYNLNCNVKLYCNVNYNFYQEHYSKEKFSADMKEGNGLGFMLGTELNYSLNQDLDLILDTGYYLANLEINERYSSYQGEVINVNDEELRISGLGLKLGIGYKF